MKVAFTPASTPNTPSRIVHPAIKMIEVELPHGHKIIIRDLGTDIAVVHEFKGEQEALLSVCHEETFQVNPFNTQSPVTVEGTEITRDA